MSLTLSVPRGLLAKDVNAYSDSGACAKEAMHKQGKTFLRKLAAELGLEKGAYDVRSNMGGIAVSGEVTLHSDDLYVQIYESCTSAGVQMLYRTCDSRKDYCGHQNHTVTMQSFAEELSQNRVLAEMRRMLSQERDRKRLRAA